MFPQILAAVLLVSGVIAIAVGSLLPAGSPKARILTLAGYCTLPAAIIAGALA